MKRFAALYQALDETTKTSVKTSVMRDYFRLAAPADGAWAVYFLSGRRFRRHIKTGDLRQWAAGLAGLPDWLFDECYHAVGDLAETIALLLPEPHGEHALSLAELVEERLQPLGKLPADLQREQVCDLWRHQTSRERLVFNKLVTGSFRVGVSQGLVIRALAEASGLEGSTIAHRLMGQWTPTEEFFRSLFETDGTDAEVSRPYPFCLAHPLPSTPEALGEPGEWSLEWKWDGIRAQLIRRADQTFLWSRGEEPILERFPELIPAANALPNGTVLDGEVIAWKEGRVLPFAELQRRIGRKSVGKKMLAEVPARFMAFDLLEENGEDCRGLPFLERRARLESLLAGSLADERLMASPIVDAEHWEEVTVLRESSRERGVEGFMLKRKNSPYGVGRPTGLWWKWKVDPYTCDAVLVYAQRGHGRRASLYTDYTFAAWDGEQLVPFAKAYSGLTDEEIRQVDRFVRQHTLEKFGPVRAVEPLLVFELAFENIQVSKRHKSGLAVRFPRISRWRQDKRPADADTLESIRNLMAVPRAGVSMQ